MRFACDTGGTFTDLVVEDGNRQWHLYKAPTTPDDPVQGVLDALRRAADHRGIELSALLAQGSSFVHATTHAINAVLTGRTAKTALLVTEGHPDILLLREGGRPDPFDFTIAYPHPYVPRHLTFEIPERIDADGSIHRPLDEATVIALCDRLRRENVEAVAVCLLWSPRNEVHELRVGALLAKHLPGVPVTLSHQLNPVPREFRRASATCIDASLKPMMSAYLDSLTSRLEAAGYHGRVFVVTSQGGVMDAASVAAAPIHVVNSGPSMAPVAGRAYAALDLSEDDIIVADTGGTTFDVSVVRGGRIPLTRELWVGAPLTGHLVGFPSVDVRSVGAGGGSIADVDTGGILQVGPQSAGAKPGPACYGRGGTAPTFTDAALLLGYLDAQAFLGGTMRLDDGAAERAVGAVAAKLGQTAVDAARSIVELATETMTQAILDITIKQGIDPARAALVGGGGAAGMNLVFIARRLGCRHMIVPEAGATLSAAGALISDLTSDHRALHYMSTSSFDCAEANLVLERLERDCRRFAALHDTTGAEIVFSHSVEARYAEQAWEIEVALPHARFDGPDRVAAFRRAFDQEHERLYAFADPASAIEIVGWRVSVACRFPDHQPRPIVPARRVEAARASRPIILPNGERRTAQVLRLDAMQSGERHYGAAVVESDFTSIVVDDGTFWRSANGSLVVDLGGTT